MNFIITSSSAEGCAVWKCGQGLHHTTDSLCDRQQIIPTHRVFISPSVKCHWYLLERDSPICLSNKHWLKFYLHMLVPVARSTNVAKMKVIELSLSEGVAGKQKQTLIGKEDAH